MTNEDLDRLEFLWMNLPRDTKEEGSDDWGHPANREWIIEAFDAMPHLISAARKLKEYKSIVFETILAPSCEDCADVKTCCVKPKWGNLGAVHCPLHKRKEAPQ